MSAGSGLRRRLLASASCKISASFWSVPQISRYRSAPRNIPRDLLQQKKHAPEAFLHVTSHGIMVVFHPSLSCIVSVAFCLQSAAMCPNVVLHLSGACHSGCACNACNLGCTALKCHHIVCQVRVSVYVTGQHFVAQSCGQA